MTTWLLYSTGYEAACGNHREHVTKMAKADKELHYALQVATRKWAEGVIGLMGLGN